MTNLIKNILIVLISSILLMLVGILIVLWTFSNSIPDYRFLKNYKPPVSSKMYSGEGELVADFSKEKRIFIPYEAIPKNELPVNVRAKPNIGFTLCPCEKISKSTLGTGI